MDSYNRFLILEKYFNKYYDENDLRNSRISLTNMKNLHGSIISNMLEVYNSKADNKLEVLSDLEVQSKKMSSRLMIAENIFNNLINDTKMKERDEISTPLLDEPTNKSSYNYVTNLDKKLPSLILFYADWCGPCKAFLPSWLEMEKTINKNNINVVKFSCVEYEQQCSKIPIITSYPTIAIYLPDKEKIIKFEDQRNAQNIRNFVKKNTNIDIDI